MYLRGMWLGVASRMDIRKTCVQKDCTILYAQPLTIIENWGELYDHFDDHKNLLFDRRQDIYMSNRKYV